MKQLQVEIRPRHFIHTLILMFCITGMAKVEAAPNMTTLQIEFPGLSRVSVQVRLSDGITNSATGSTVKNVKRKTNSATIKLPQGLYDLVIKKGTAQLIVDDVDCQASSCLVDNITATLTVLFPGVPQINISVYLPDNIVGSVSGRKVTYHKKQQDQAEIIVFRQIYDLQVQKGLVKKIIDNVDCTSGFCTVQDLVANLTVKFPGLTGVHTSVLIADGKVNRVRGKKVAKTSSQTDETMIPLLRAIYDVKVEHIVDNIFDDVDCNAASCEVSITDIVPAQLINGDSNQPLANKKLSAYEILPDGTLIKFQAGKTNSEGRVGFTLAGVDSGKVYVLKAYNPLGKKKDYYSAFITNTGEHQFIVSIDGDKGLDLIPPEVIITSPLNATQVLATGFQVSGTATDNSEIDHLELTITDPVKGSNTITPNYNPISQTWVADIGAVLVTLGEDITLTATAFDLSQRQHSSSVMVTAVVDDFGPSINITSHIENQEVPATGFLLSGTVTDLTEVASLQATLVDSGLGETLSNVAVDFASNTGIWTLVIGDGLMSEGGTVDITLDAVDTLANNTSTTIQFVVVAADFSNAHMINRITFGATPSLLEEVNDIGAQAFLDEQLDPDTIDDSNFNALVVDLPTTKEELQAWTLMHMAYSERQLLEVMTWFWDNHFNTDINTERTKANGKSVSDTVGYELAENQDFRVNAFGNFRDLLGISAKSPAMLIYLDSISNVANDSNENFTRELLELLSMGVDGGYTHHEIEAGAEIFTGWHIKKGQFFFDASKHTGGSYTVFDNIIIADGGVIQGEQFLDAIANHESTAEYICTKLIRVFVSDIAPATLVDNCAQTFMGAVADDDQIKQVLRTILESSEFYQPEYYRGKIKTPVELVVGSVRLLDATSSGTDLIGPIRAMGMRLYENPVPTGWSEIGADWINSSLLIERIKWLNAFVRTTEASDNSASDPIPFYTAYSFATADGIVGFLLQLTTGDVTSDLSRQNALDVLGADFNISNQNSDTLLRQLNGTVMSYPQYQSQ